MSQSQLEWRCRRGVRELDVLFTLFLQKEYGSLEESQRADFERLLEIQDPIIMDWLFAKASPEDDGLNAMIARLQKLSQGIS